MKTGYCIKRPENETDTEERHATWLELFFDLIFVAVVAQITHRLESALDWGSLLASVGLFLPVWWIWAGHTVYATRFDTGDLPYHILTFVQMFAMVAIAVQLSHFSHASANIYALAYLLARGILLAMLVRAHATVPAARPATRLYIVGFGAGALCWAASLAADGNAKYVLWGLGMIIDMATPWYGWLRGFLQKFTVEHSHLSERFGLLIIILLGETVVAIVAGLSETGWTAGTLAAAAGGFLLAVLIWSIYFSFLEKVRKRMELRSGQPYIYIHLPLIFGIGGIGVGIQKSIIAAGHHGSWMEAGLFLGTGLVIWTLAFLGLHRISGIGR
jgi:low temperature requirement protein LtrA